MNTDDRWNIGSSASTIVTVRWRSLAQPGKHRPGVCGTRLGLSSELGSSRAYGRLHSLWFSQAQAWQQTREKEHQSHTSPLPESFEYLFFPLLQTKSFLISIINCAESTPRCLADDPSVQCLTVQVLPQAPGRLQHQGPLRHLPMHKDWSIPVKMRVFFRSRQN